MTNCEVCGKEDLFSYVTQEGVCAACTLKFSIPNINFADLRRQRIAASRALIAELTPATRGGIPYDGYPDRSCPHCGASKDHPERRYPYCRLCNPPGDHTHTWNDHDQWSECVECHIEVRGKPKPTPKPGRGPSQATSVCYGPHVIDSKYSCCWPFCVWRFWTAVEQGVRLLQVGRTFPEVPPRVKGGKP